MADVIDLNRDMCDDCSEKWRQHHLGDDPCTLEEKSNCMKYKQASLQGKIEITKKALKNL